MPGVRLSEREASGIGIVTRVSAQDSDSLSLLQRLGLVPGASVEVFEGGGSGVRVAVEGDRFLVPAELAHGIWIKEKSE